MPTDSLPAPAPAPVPVPAPAAAIDSVRRAVGALLLSFANFFLTMCMCGHHDWQSVPGNLLAIALAGSAFVWGKDRRPWVRWLVAAALGLTIGVSMKNAHNVLWSGHTALLGR